MQGPFLLHHQKDHGSWWQCGGAGSFMITSSSSSKSVSIIGLMRSGVLCALRPLFVCALGLCTGMYGVCVLFVPLALGPACLSWRNVVPRGSLFFS